MLSSYDIVNNRKCPFCDSDITKDNTGANYYDHCYDHCYCPNKCIKVMYEKNNGRWLLIRIFMPEISIETDIRHDDAVLRCSGFGPNQGITFPLFDVFSYSLPDLQNKMKTYLLFS